MAMLLLHMLLPGLEIQPATAELQVMYPSLTVGTFTRGGSTSATHGRLAKPIGPAFQACPDSWQVEFAAALR